MREVAVTTRELSKTATGKEPNLANAAEPSTRDTVDQKLARSPKPMRPGTCGLPQAHWLFTRIVPSIFVDEDVHCNSEFGLGLPHTHPAGVGDKRRR
jgi:hypothetical protein